MSALAIAIMTCAIWLACAPSAGANSIQAWGANVWDQLGDGPWTLGWEQPVTVSGLRGVTAIAAGGRAGFALLGNGTVMAWGYNARGEVGDGTREPRYYPVPVKELSGVHAIAPSMALLNNGEVRAWGENGDGEVGNGSTSEAVLLPVPVKGLHEVTAIAQGMALLKNGTVVDWGANFLGELGDGEFGGFSDVPVQVQGLTEVIAIASAGGHRLALRKDGTVWAWGEDEYGELGNGKTEASAVPVEVSGLTNVIAISDGGDHNLALLANGTVMAWGSNDWGQLGDGTTSGPEQCGPFACASIPIPVSGVNEGSTVAGRYPIS
jgi:alpha-tubulin suppressor-like RCC1 family protein